MRRLGRLAAGLPGWAAWALGLLPLAWLVVDTLTGRLGIDPVEALEHRLGRTAFYFLAASLAVTPALRILRLNLVRHRRTLGLLAFLYAALHLAAWVVFDMRFLWAQLLADLVKRPYLALGAGALILLMPLALTSNAASIRRLGAEGWRRLHAAVYPAVLLVCLHWLSAGKVVELRPALWTVAILVLLALRLVPARRRRLPASR